MPSLSQGSGGFGDRFVVQWTSLNHGNRWTAQNYRGRQHYFVTICSFRRRSVFAPPANCDFVLKLLRSESGTKVSRFAYCLMGDHLHFLAEGLQPASDLLVFLKSFKIKTSRWFAKRNNTILWQRGYYEHILRHRDQIEPVAWYIWLNQVRKGLTSTGVRVERIF